VGTYSVYLGKYGAEKGKYVTYLGKYGVKGGKYTERQMKVMIYPRFAQASHPHLQAALPLRALAIIRITMKARPAKTAIPIAIVPALSLKKSIEYPLSGVADPLY
jgi:hypothetical protein